MYDCKVCDAIYANIGFYLCFQVSSSRLAMKQESIEFDWQVDGAKQNRPD